MAAAEPNSSRVAETVFLSDSDRYERYNFQNQEDLAALVRLLSAPPGDRVPPILLAGETGIGRSYFLQAALYRARSKKPELRSAEIDLADYEPDNPAAFPDFVDAKLKGASEENRQSFYQLVEMLFAGCQAEKASINDTTATPTPGLAFAAAVCLLPIGMSLADSLRLFRRTFGGLQAARGNHWTLLRLVLEPLTRGRRLVLHFPDSGTLAEPLRAFYAEEAERNPNLTLVYSCSGADHSYAIALTSATRRFELSALHKGELSQALERQFQTKALAPLTEPLMQYSRGRAGLIARAVHEMVTGKAVVFDPGEGWQLAPEKTDHPSVQSLGRDLYGEVAGALDKTDEKKRPVLELWFWAASLCGDWLPVKLLLSFVGVPAEKEDAWIDLIDDLFANVFEDRGYEDSVWPGQLIYAFRDPDLARAALEHCTLDRARLSQELVRFLDSLTAPGLRQVNWLLWKAARFHAGTRQNVERRFRWWVDEQSAPVLTAFLRGVIADGKDDPKRLLAAALRLEGKEPAYRTLAVANALFSRTDQGVKTAVPDDRMAQLMALRGRLVYKMGRYRRAEVLLAQAFEAECMQSGEEAAFLSSVAKFLALTWLRLGDSAKWAFFGHSDLPLKPRAEVAPASSDDGESPLMRFLSRMLEVRSARGGPHDPGLVPPLRLLSTLTRGQGKYQEAEELLRRALANQQARLGAHHPNLSLTLAGLGMLRIQQGEYGHAGKLLRRAIDLAETKRGTSHRALAAALHGLGLVHEARGKLDQARKVMTRALEIQEANLGAEHPETRAMAADLKRLG